MNAKLRKSGQDRTSPQARDLGQGIWQGWTTGTFWLFEMLLRAAVKETWRQSSRAPKRGNRAVRGGANFNRRVSKFEHIVVARWFDELHSRIRQNLEFCYKFQCRRCKDPEGQQFHACAGCNKPIQPCDDCLCMEKSGNSVVVPELAEPTSTPPSIVMLPSSPFRIVFPIGY